MARPTCLYCGVPLPADLQAQAEAAAALARAEAREAPPGFPRGQGFTREAAPAALDRLVLVADVTGAPASLLAELLGLSAFEAGVRARAGGLHLHRVGPIEEVKAEASILAEAGMRIVTFPEAEARAAPVVATGGEQDGRRLRLRTSEGPTDVSAAEVLLVVLGPIQREYQARQVERKNPSAATLEAGYRFHLHRRNEPRPVELDPASFAFGTRGTVAGSSLLELKAWIADLGDLPSDDGFRRLPVALAPALPEEGTAASLRRTGGGPGRSGEARTILDNLAQFRFYSGWRAAAYRRR